MYNNQQNKKYIYTGYLSVGDYPKPTNCTLTIREDPKLGRNLLQSCYSIFYLSNLLSRTEIIQKIILMDNINNFFWLIEFF